MTVRFRSAKVQYFRSAIIIIGLTYDSHYHQLKFYILVGTLAKREADFSMNLALTGERERVIDYSVAYMGKSVTFYGYSVSSYDTVQDGG